jgi:hypothetical protein
VHLLLVLALPAALLIGLLIAIWSPAKTDDDTKDAQNQDVPSENVQNKTGRNKDAQENRSVRKHNRDRGAGAGDLGVQPDQGQQDVLTRVGRDA